MMVVFRSRTCLEILGGSLTLLETVLWYSGMDSRALLLSQLRRPVESADEAQ
jgi:hypothetical protein